MTPNSDDDRVDEIAEAIADGRAPDWERLEREAGSEDARKAIEAYRRLAELGDLFVTASSGAGERERIVLAPGATWGKLTIVEHLGHGRFGDVYRARDASLDRDVALKLINSDDEPLRTQVIEEGRLMARLRHPNIVTIYGAERIEGVTGLSMELVDGRTLEAELAERGPLDADELAAIGRQLCAALDAVHTAELVHRDVKASNVMRDSTGRFVLGDFGTGVEMDRARSATGALAGTPVYLAPEVFEGGAATPRSDLYSLGTLLFHLATGEYPQAPGSLAALRDAHRREPARSLRELRPDLPKALLDAVDTALATDPAGRPESAAAMAEALAPRGRRWWPLAAVAVLLVVAIAAAIVLLQPPRDEDGLIPTLFVEDLQRRAQFRGPVVGHIASCSSYEEPHQNVSLCNLSSNEITVLRPGSQTEFASAGRSLFLSADGNWVAYVFVTRIGAPGAVGSIQSIRAISTSGGPERVLEPGGPGVIVSLRNWSGDRVLVERYEGDRREVLLLSLDGSREVIWELGPDDSLVDLSPDQRVLVFHRQNRDLRTGEARDLDLGLVDLQAGVASLWLEGATSDRSPYWFPDGSGVAFVSDRMGSDTVMVQRFADGRPQGSPEIVRWFRRVTARLHGFGPDGTLYVNTSEPFNTALVAEIDLEAGRVGPPVPVDAATLRDTLGPGWDSNGQRIAYLRGGAGNTATRGELVIRDDSPRGTTPIATWLPRQQSVVRWSPDNQWLAVESGAGPDLPLLASSIGILSVADGAPAHVVEGIGLSHPRWGQSSRYLYYRRGTTIQRFDRETDETENYFSGERRVSALGRAGFDVRPADGALVIAANREGGLCQILVVTPDQPVVEGYESNDHCQAMAVSPDSRYILLSTIDEDAQPFLIRLDANGDNPQVISTELDLIHSISFHPDGSTIAFAAGNPRFWMARFEGLARR